MTRELGAVFAGVFLFVAAAVAVVHQDPWPYKPAREPAPIPLPLPRPDEAPPFSNLAVKADKGVELVKVIATIPISPSQYPVVAPSPAPSSQVGLVNAVVAQVETPAGKIVPVESAAPPTSTTTARSDPPLKHFRDGNVCTQHGGWRRNYDHGKRWRCQYPQRD